LTYPEYRNVIEKTFDVEFIDELLLTYFSDEFLDGSDSTYVRHVSVVEFF
jgi:hypothetical protein